jgi:outer membrane protein assembly factor BamC
VKPSRFALLVIVALQVACANSLDRRYLDTSLGQPLEIPPDLASFDAKSDFDLPKSIKGEDPEVRDKVPVLAKVDSVKLNGRGDLHWLTVDDSVSDLYQKIKNFWAFEGYGLVMDEPVIGIMQTEWVYKEEGASRKDVPWWQSLFATEDLSASQDQFRTRIERDESGKGARVYITHRGTEYVYEFDLRNKNAGGSGNDWGFRASEPELEVEMLSRLMIYLGVQQEDVDNQLAKMPLFQPRAIMDVDASEKSPYLMLFDPYHIAWNRVYQLLLRLNFDIESAEFKSGLSGEGSFIVKSKVVKPEPAEKKGFFSFISEPDRKNRKFTLVLSEKDHENTRLVLEDDKGNFDTSPEGAQFISLLYEHLR